MHDLAEKKICDACGSSLDLDMLSGFCPGCLLDAVLKTEGEVPAGTRIEDYELLGEVARGGMGIVYRARQGAPSRVVALKMILPSHLNSSGAVSRFRAEAEVAASLDHESILPIYAVGEHDGAPFYSMKFAENGPLAARIGDYRDKPREAALLIAKLARAVAFAHEHGVLHRDLKPANVLFDRAAKPYVSDFGLAKWLQRECDLTQTIAILGTPYYMAPEQAKDSRAVTSAADIYSLGAILYHMLTGNPPVSGETPMEVLHHAAEQRPKSIRPTNRRVPRDLETICLKCLEKEPGARYTSAAALADDLENLCADRPIRARPVTLTNRAWRWSRRNPAAAALSAATLVLLVCLAAIVPLRRELSKSAPLTKAVAVLPFDHPGADKTGELLASGLQDDILVSLSKIADLKVISRNSVTRYAGTQTDPAEIGRTLGVDAVLVGSLRQSGHQARVNVQLMRTVDATEIWADNYDRDLNDVFAIQGDLALQIASALKATVLPMEASGIRQRPTNDARAYLLYVQAADLFADTDKPRRKLEETERLLDEAIARDPKFALAIALLSQTETVLADWHSADMHDMPSRLERAKSLAEQSLLLQPQLPEAHIALGRYLWQGQGHVGEADLAGALRELETARRTLPGSAEIYNLIGRVQRRMGRWEECLANVTRAAQLDPNTASRWDDVYSTNLWLRRYPAALEALQRQIALAPNSWRCEWLRVWLFLQWKGDAAGLRRLRPPPWPEATRYSYLWFITQLYARDFDKAEAIVRDDPRERLPGYGFKGGAPKSLFLGRIYSEKGDGVKAREHYAAALPVVEESVRQSPLDAERRMTLARVYAELDRKGDAIREGKRACELLPEWKDAIDGVDLTMRLAEIYMRVNEPEQALPLLDHLLSIPAGLHVEQMRVAPVWDPLRNDARFQRLLAKYASR
jgi:serine/threonine protein kinase/tetratricopeptide (TPR) repeat protein